VVDRIGADGIFDMHTYGRHTQHQLTSDCRKELVDLATVASLKEEDSAEADAVCQGAIND
jgi:hypothetical protein